MTQLKAWIEELLMIIMEFLNKLGVIEWLTDNNTQPEDTESEE